MRRSLRSAFVLGVLAGLIVALVRALAREGRPGPAPLATPSPPLPAGTSPAPTRTPVPEVAIRSGGNPPDLIASSQGDDEPQPTWVAPVDGDCPDGFPIKAKEGSGIYHRPGGLSYARTRPDRCYADEAAAEADGYRAAKR